MKRYRLKKAGSKVTFEDIRDNVLLVHAFKFEYLDKYDIVVDNEEKNYYFKSIIDTGKLSDDMTHCSWGSLVLPHLNGSWELLRCAIITPLKYQLGNVYKLFPADTMIFGSLHINKNDFTVIIGITAQDIDVELKEIFADNKYIHDTKYEHINKFKNEGIKNILNKIKNIGGNIVLFNYGVNENITEYFKNIAKKIGRDYDNDINLCLKEPRKGPKAIEENSKIDTSKLLDDLDGLDIYYTSYLKFVFNNKNCFTNGKLNYDKILDLLELFSINSNEEELLMDFPNKDKYELTAKEIYDNFDNSKRFIKSRAIYYTSLKNAQTYYVKLISEIMIISLRSVIDSVVASSSYKLTQCEDKNIHPTLCFRDKQNNIIDIKKSPIYENKQTKNLFIGRHLGGLSTFTEDMDFITAIQRYFEKSDNIDKKRSKIKDTTNKIKDKYCKNMEEKYELLLNRELDSFGLSNKNKEKLKSLFEVFQNDICK